MQLSEVFIFNLPLFSGELLFTNSFIEDWAKDFKLPVKCDDNLCVLFPLFLGFFESK